MHRLSQKFPLEKSVWKIREGRGRNRICPFLTPPKGGHFLHRRIASDLLLIRPIFLSLYFAGEPIPGVTFPSVSPNPVKVSTTTKKNFFLSSSN